MQTSPSQAITMRPTGRVWLGGVVIAGIILYVVLDAIIQALPPHDSPITQAESDLGVGPYGWLMSLNFVVRGLVALAVVAGIQHTWTRSRSKWLGQWLLLLCALGDVQLALFATDVPPSRGTIHGDITSSSRWWSLSLSPPDSSFSRVWRRPRSAGACWRSPS
jgi:hypothetical protein